MKIFAILSVLVLLLTLVGVLSLMMNLAVTMIIANKRMEIMRLTLRDGGKLMATTVAGINQIETLKASGAENGFFQKWSGYQASVNAQQIRVNKMEQYLGSIPNLVSTLADLWSFRRRMRFGTFAQCSTLPMIPIPIRSRPILNITPWRKTFSNWICSVTMTRP